MLSGAKVVDAEAVRAALRAAEAEKEKKKREDRGGGGNAATTATTAAAAGTSSPAQQQQPQREAWLTDPSLARQRRPASPPRATAAAAAAAAAAGTSSVLMERPAGLSAGAAGAAPPPPPSSSAAPASVVGDGGASWRLKALRRAQQEAQAAGKDFREVVEERWGSVAELAASAVAAGRRRGGGGSGGGNEPLPPRPSSFSAHLHAARDRARALGVEERLAERRAANEAAMGGDEGERRRDRDRGGRGEQERKRGRDRSSSDGSDDGRRRRRRRHEQFSSSYLSGGSGAGESMRRPGEGGGGGGGGLSWRRRGADDERRRRERDDWRGDDRNGRGRESDGSYRPRPRQSNDDETAALLSAAASSMNAFASDGSFMKRFGEKEKEKGKEEEKEKGKGTEGAAAAATEAEPPPLRPPPPPAPRPSVAAPAPMSSSFKASDANRGAAAMLRARLGGGGSGAKASFASPPPPPAAAPAAAAAATAATKAGEVVDLPLVDSRGRAAPGAFGREASLAAAAAAAAPPPGGQQQPRRRIERFDGDGNKARYFRGDDASSSLTAAELAKRTRLGDDAGVSLDVDRALADTILRQGTRYKATGASNDFGADDEYDADAGLDSLEDPRFSSKKRKKAGAPSQADRARAALVGAATREQRALDACRWCLRRGGGSGGGSNVSGQNLPPLFLVVAATERAYLAVPTVNRRLVPGQLIIAPTRHAPSEREVDEDVATDMRNFKKTAIRMHLAGFGQQSSSSSTSSTSSTSTTLFVESALRPRDTRSHAVVNCFPLNASAASAAPGVIKQSVDDASDEWSTHHSKRLIETGKTEKGQIRTLASSVPPGFGYLRFELGLSRGWVSVVDDDADAAKRADLARAVPAALLRLPPEAGKGRRGRGWGGARGSGEGEAEAEAAESRRAVLEARRAFEPFGEWVA